MAMFVTNAASAEQLAVRGYLATNKKKEVSVRAPVLLV
jgi:hypothetical protein